MGEPSNFGFMRGAIQTLRRVSSFGDPAPVKPEPAEDGTVTFTPPPLAPVELHGFNDNTKTRLMNSAICEEVRNLLPSRLQLYDTWTLCYSLEQHGASLHTLYDNNTPVDLRNRRSGYVLVLKDSEDNVFGAYANEHFHPTDTKRFYGNGESFLWKVKKLDDGEIRFQAFPYTGLNDFVIFCTPSFLSMGGGDGHYGLWLDDNIDKGVSSRSLTFGNEPLSDAGNKFNILALEVWRVGGI
jgi:hypothetical protein